MPGLGTAGMALASEKGLSVWLTTSGAGLALMWAMALASLKGSSDDDPNPPKLRLRPPRKRSDDEALPPRWRDGLIRRRCASRSSSRSSMPRRVRKSGVVPGGLPPACFSFIPRGEPKRSSELGFFLFFSRQLKLMSAVRRVHQSMKRSLVVTSGLRPVAAEESGRLLFVVAGSMNCEFPRFMSTDGFVLPLLPPRVTMRLMLPLIFRMLYPRAALNLSARGVGPMLPRLMTYAPFSSGPRALSIVRGVRSVLRRFLATLRLHHHPKKATMLISRTPPITPPATATVDWMALLLLATGTALTAPFVEEEEPVASAAALFDGPGAVPMVVNKGVALSGSAGDDVTSGRAVPCSRLVVAVSAAAVSAAVCVAGAVSTLSV